MDTGKQFFWPTILVVAALLVAAVLLTLLKSATEEVRAPTASAPVSSPPARPLLADRGFADADFGADHASSQPSPPVIPLAAEGEEPVQPWERSVNELLDSDDENDVVAAKLAALGPSLPLEGYVESIQHMVNLLDDEQYKLASDMLMNPSLRPEVREVIFSDVLDRPNEVKVPVLLVLMGSPGHPLQPEAREKMQLLIGRDLGNDPAVWRAAARDFVARSAAEDAAAEAAAEDFEEPPGKGEN